MMPLINCRPNSTNTTRRGQRLSKVADEYVAEMRAQGYANQHDHFWATHSTPRTPSRRRARWLAGHNSGLQDPS
ncbi:hypothetical protein EV643_11550 [Kribbella sp. VKM Ac-2527]|uniref:Uncharacterized protein n=1 Tax=Kribbella caucasensis TaxID=2512215 RepID=A0A4V3C989_9ACTN|nr:hypothetical protein EV643_11550 [Kribbella sp. VKM Ac-2527]